MPAAAASVPAGRLTWAAARPYVRVLPGPLTQALLGHDETFFELYGEVLSQLDGSDLLGHFTFSFVPDRVDQTTWAFKDESSREDFADWCTELGLLPSLRRRGTPGRGRPGGER